MDVRAAFAFLLAATASACSTLPDEGESCTRTEDCSRGLECVAVFDDRSVCLPQPENRALQSCAADDDCVFSSKDQWPVEVECLDGQCRCIEGEKPCDEDEDGNTLILEPETCRCVSRGREGDDCFSARTCGPGLGCERTTNECRTEVSAGSTCNESSDCASGTCLSFEDGVGTCQ